MLRPYATRARSSGEDNGTGHARAERSRTRGEGRPRRKDVVDEHHGSWSRAGQTHARRVGEPVRPSATHLAAAASSAQAQSNIPPGCLAEGERNLLRGIKAPHAATPWCGGNGHQHGLVRHQRRHGRRERRCDRGPASELQRPHEVTRHTGILARPADRETLTTEPQDEGSWPCRGKRRHAGRAEVLAGAGRTGAGHTSRRREQRQEPVRIHLLTVTYS